MTLWLPTYLDQDVGKKGHLGKVYYTYIGIDYNHFLPTFFPENNPIFQSWAFTGLQKATYFTKQPP